VVFHVGFPPLGVFSLKFKDNTFDGSCIALNLELLLEEIIVELEPPLIATYLLPEGKDVPKIKVITVWDVLNRSKSCLLRNLNWEFLLLYLFLCITAKTDNLNFVFS
jgi:hypothetical protein